MFLLATLVVFSGLVSVVLLANSRQNLNRILIGMGFDRLAPSEIVEVPEQAHLEVRPPPAPIIYVPDGLMDQSVLPPQEAFRRTITRSRDDICSALQKGGWVSEDWQAGDTGNQAWSCGAEKFVDDATGSSTPAGSLFISARGLNAKSVSSVRLKINFLNGETTGPVLEQAITATRDIMSAIGWGDDVEVLEKLGALTEFNLKGNGNRISLSRELGDVPRYNFLIASDSPAVAATRGPTTANKRWLKSPLPRQ